MSSDNKVIQYLNNVKSLLNEEIKLNQNEIETIEKEIELYKHKSKNLNKVSIENEENVRQLENQIKDVAKEFKLKYNDVDNRLKLSMDIVQLKEQIKLIQGENKRNDSAIDKVGDMKTEMEQQRLTLEKYKIDCKGIIDTIETNIEEPDQCDNTVKKEIQDDINTLITKYKPYQLDKLKALLPTST